MSEMHNIRKVLLPLERGLVQGVARLVHAAVDVVIQRHEQGVVGPELSMVQGVEPLSNILIVTHQIK